MRRALCACAVIASGPLKGGRGRGLAAARRAGAVGGARRMRSAEPAPAEASVGAPGERGGGRWGTGGGQGWVVLPAGSPLPPVLAGAAAGPGLAVGPGASLGRGLLRVGPGAVAGRPPPTGPRRPRAAGALLCLGGRALPALPSPHAAGVRTGAALPGAGRWPGARRAPQASPPSRGHRWELRGLGVWGRRGASLLSACPREGLWALRPRLLLGLGARRRLPPWQAPPGLSVPGGPGSPGAFQ